MPITLQYENNKQDVIITVTGIVAGEEFLHEMNDLFSDEQAIRNYRYGLNDFTQLEQFESLQAKLFHWRDFTKKHQ